MKNKICFLLLVFLLFPLSETVAQHNNNLRYEVMLSSSMSDSLDNMHFIGCIDISPDRLITLATRERIYLLGWGGMTTYGNKADEPIFSFAYTSDSLLMVVKGKSLCYIDSSGIFKELIKLPNPDMGISSGKRVVYLYDRNKADNRYHLYAYAKGGIYKNILVSPKPIMSVVEMGDSLYVAAGSSILSLSPGSGKMNLCAGLQKDNVILSITPDIYNDVLYFSLKDAIFAIRNNTVYNVTGDFGGGLTKCFGHGIVIYNPDTKDIIRIVNKEGSAIF